MYEVKIIKDGTEADLDLLSPSFPYNFESGSIAELTDRSASWSFSIELPRSRKNEAVFGLAGECFVRNVSPYNRYVCNVYSDGVCIINRGVLFIDTATRTSYKVQILSGCADVFERMKDMDWANGTDWYSVHMPLREMSEGDGVVDGKNYVIWRDFRISDDQSLTTSKFVSGFLGYATPRVNAGYLIDQILERLGYTINMPNSDVYRMWIVPTKRKNVANSAGVTIATKRATRLIPSSNQYYTGVVSDFTTTIYTNQFGTLLNDVCQDSSVSWSKATVTIGLVSQILNNAGSSYFGKGGEIRCGGVTIDKDNWTQYRVGNNLVVEITGDYFPMHVSVSCDNTVWQGGDLGANVSGVKFGQITIDYQLDQITTTDTPHAGAVFPILPNIGFATALDFFKMICQVMGWFVEVDSNASEIKCYNMSTVTGNKGSARDWSSKLVEGDREVRFDFGSYARVNNIKYKENKVTGYNDSSYFEIPNENIAPTKDILSVAICSSPHDRLSYVEIYQADEDGGYKYKEGANPHLLYSPQYTSYFYHFMANRVKQMYSALTSILQQAFVIKAQFALTPIDIINNESTIPVYLSQYGAYFYVNKIESWESGKVCTVQLLKI